MTVNEVNEEVAIISELRRDYEAAHSREDLLHEHVLISIAANGDAESAALAKAALQTRTIRFARHCA